MTLAAVIVAAGRGSRASEAGGLPKQYATLAGTSVLQRCIDAILSCAAIRQVQVVIGLDEDELYRSAIRCSDARVLPPVHGGSTRQESVRLGLTALAVHVPSQVLIHDAARPFVTIDVIGRVVAGLRERAGAIAALPLADTLKRGGAHGEIVETVARDGLWRAQTPQGFDYAAISDAHAKAHAAGWSDFTDDAAIAEWAGLDVRLVAGSEANLKLTTREDLDMAEQRLATSSSDCVREVRTGQGFDVHRFAPGTAVWLCGVEIPHIARLEGHSDADAGLHALTDALLGAISAGDIGDHFPPADPQWKNAASHIFLAHAARLIADRGGRIVNVDVTILAEAPRIAPHRESMCLRIAAILAIDRSRVSVKATTTEELGFTGRREGIAAMAQATITLPAV